MKIAVLSDIHSNKYALEATLNFLAQKEIEKFIFLGDYFGYYPWAKETFNELGRVSAHSIFIIGNHDELIARSEPPMPLPEYWDVIIQNRSELPVEAIEWLNSLSPEKTVVIDNIVFKLCHGTPESPLSGRFYPDTDKVYDWFPKKNEVLLLGHTHYPIVKKIQNGGVIVNPGSVGQPRDGILDSSFCVVDTKTLDVKVHRVPYFVENVISELEDMNWYPRAIKSLKKINSK